MHRVIGVAALLLAACGSNQTPESASEDPPAEPEVAGAEPEVALPDDEPSAAIDVATPNTIDESGVRWALEADPIALTMAERSRFTLRIIATNESAASVDPQQHLGEFRLDGAAHLGLNLWFGNGLRSNAWSDLPPGASVRDERRPGEHLFEAPGTYVIAYAHGRATTAVTVTVTE